MRLPGLLLVAGLVGLGAQAYAAAPWTDAPKAAPARRAPPRTARQQQVTPDDICRTVAQAATENQIPADFLARVIWQESRFNARAVSPKGAEGIAQFTPQTAVFRGLANPFDPISSLENAARYLGDLRKMFGNLGLAAAGYNAGPGRVREWLDGKSGLPRETRSYVTITTGRTADAWASSSPPRAPDNTIPPGLPCGSIARLILAPPSEATMTGAGRIAACVPPWGTAVTAIWSGPRAWAFRTPQPVLARLVGNREPIMLRRRFGNLGRAEACANADPAWVRQWRNAKGALIATAWAGDGWALPQPVQALATGPSQGVAAARTTPVVLEAPEQPHGPGQLPIWGAQLTANWSAAGAWATYRAMQKQFAALIGDRKAIVLHGSFPGLGAAPRYMIRIADNRRAPLEELCSKLIAAGGACAVLRNVQDQGDRPPQSQ